MDKRVLTNKDAERIYAAIRELEKKLNEFKPEIDDSEIRGGYYIPTVDADGDLSWSPSKEGMPAVATVNINGPRGLAGVSATHRWNGTELTISSASGTSTRDLEGPKGDPGITPNLRIGTVTTLPADEDATATITGTKENPILNLGIPKGQNGTGGNGSGVDGVGIDSVEQTTVSIENGGTNIITVTKTDGTSSNFEVRNGSKGDTGNNNYIPSLRQRRSC